MIGLDTNVLVRFFMQDDQQQANLAKSKIDSLTVEEPGFVSIICLIELSWVLGRSYQLERQAICLAIEALLDSREIVVDRADSVRRALAIYRKNTADFTDCIIERTGADAGCKSTLTFDVIAARDTGMTLIEEVA